MRSSFQSAVGKLCSLIIVGISVTATSAAAQSGIGGAIALACALKIDNRLPDYKKLYENCVKIEVAKFQAAQKLRAEALRREYGDHPQVKEPKTSKYLPQVSQQATTEDAQSANYLIDVCRLLANGETPKLGSDAYKTGGDMLKYGLCLGEIKALIWAAPALQDNQVRSCPPSTATVLQATKVIVAYLDQNPARLHEQFLGLAREALAHAWPCSTQ